MNSETRVATATAVTATAVTATAVTATAAPGTAALATAVPAPASATQLESALQVCSHCGGSGILRLDDQRFRTCLDCLGQGRVRVRQHTPVPYPATEVIQIARPREGAPISGSASSAAA